MKSLYVFFVGLFAAATAPTIDHDQLRTETAAAFAYASMLQDAPAPTPVVPTGASATKSTTNTPPAAPIKAAAPPAEKPSSAVKAPAAALPAAPTATPAQLKPWRQFRMNGHLYGTYDDGLFYRTKLVSVSRPFTVTRKVCFGDHCEDVPVTTYRTVQEEQWVQVPEPKPSQVHLPMQSIVPQYGPMSDSGWQPVKRFGR